jgi:ATP-dependent helicase/nuclease subunit B
MDIIFGLCADGGAFPDHGGGSSGALGAPVVGPNGLIDILETFLGLSQPPSAHVVRIAAWQAALASVDQGQRFWSKSFAVDAWSSASTLLGWRDMLIDAGWDPGHAWPDGRIADLAAAELTTADCSPGLGDRLRAVIASITPSVAQSVRRIRLIDARALHPTGWRDLLGALEVQGVQIEQIVPTAAAPADTALGKLQRWMLGTAPHGTSPDGTLTLGNAASNVLAADLVGQWSDDAGSTPASLVIVAQNGDTQLLDHGLSAAGQPKAGRSRRSPHRGTLQLLQLGFRIAWSPFDPHALMELLMFARSPIAVGAAARLAVALEEAPGRGSDVWLNAWVDIAAREAAAATTDKERTAIGPRLARWRAWAEPALSDPVAGMVLTDAIAICDRTIAWAVARHANEPDSLYLATATLAGDVRSALVALNRPVLPRTLVERVIDQALDTGYDDPSAFAEAAHWRSVSHPGGVWAGVDNLVWWDFATTAEGTTRAPWTKTEQAMLAAAGTPLDDPGIAGQVLSAAWERSILNCRGHLLLVSSGLNGHDEAALHPVAHRIAPALKDSANHIRLEDAISGRETRLAGKTLQRVAIAPALLPEAKTQWVAPAGYAARLEGHVESATSFENLLSCHLKWALKHIAHLRLGRARSIPDENRLLGNIAHAIARTVFAPGVPPSPEDAAARTRMLLDETIDQIAAPLRHAAHAADLAFAERRLPLAMSALAESLVANNLIVEATELQVSGTFEEALAVRGAIDLVARDSRGEIVIVDLKWSRSTRSRIDELRLGQAVQLASYGAMAAGEAPYRAGYFMLNQRQFLTLAADGLIGRAIDGARTLPETWTAIRLSWKAWRDAGTEGYFLATGVDGAVDEMPGGATMVREVTCKWCDYQSLCRVRGLK